MQDRTYTAAETQAKLAETLPAWQYTAGKLNRTYPCNGWRASTLLFNAIAHLAEAAWHHPEVEVAWNGVTVNLMTHSANGITDKDFVLAKHIEQWATWQPAANSPLEGTPLKGPWRYRQPT
jgi:pterin-4a-carbinolamine dehydratase